MCKIIQIVGPGKRSIRVVIARAVAMETDVGMIKIGTVDGETAKKVSIVIADSLGRKKGFRELRTVIHADVGVSIVKEMEAKIAMANTKHAANAGVGTMKIEGRSKGDVVG